MGALSFHPLKVTAVERTAEDATCVTVEIPAALREAFAHHAGQYVTVRRTINERDERRTYSIVTAPGRVITPVLSLATDILGREPRSRFTLIYGNRSISRTMFLEETLALKNRYMDRFSVHFVMSREPQQTEWLNGRIDGHKIRELARHLP